MKKEIFKKKIEQELKKLNREQGVHFAWRCAVDALPFLGSKGSFNYWKKEDRQKYIYAIFNALDVNAAAYAYVTTAAAANAYTAAVATNAYTATNAIAYADNSNAAYAYAATNANADATNATVAYAIKNNINLESILLQNLNAIQDKKDQNIQIDWYGKIWGNFQKSLKAENCEYWGRLYQSIFEQGLVLDRDALKRRINVPKEIREQGAAAVGNYLEELEKGATRLNEARILILGDKGAGKTCLARRLVDPKAQMTTDDESTAGVNTMPWKLEDENINVRIWDFAGHTVTHAVHQFFLSERCLYIMVYDGRTEERNRLEYWLNHMENYGGDSSYPTHLKRLH